MEVLGFEVEEEVVDWFWFRLEGWCCLAWSM
jgi:hypothetical protein